MKKKKTYHIGKLAITLTACCALLLACADRDVVETTSVDKPFNLQAQLQQDNVTRANDNGFAHGDQIGVFVVNYEGENTAPTLQLSGNHADNVRFTYDDNEYKWTGSYQLSIGRTTRLR